MQTSSLLFHEARQQKRRGTILPFSNKGTLPSDEPNIFCVDGNSNLQTPRIDSLAREGALFERFYVCPLCAPTRAEFLTGRYHSH